MRYLVSYKVRRNNAKRHILAKFNSIEEADTYMQNRKDHKYYEFTLFKCNWVKVKDYERSDNV